MKVVCGNCGEVFPLEASEDSVEAARQITESCKALETMLMEPDRADGHD